MKKRLKDILITLFGAMSLALTPAMTSAQTLPLMPSDPAVSTGVLPNGLTYYIVKNPTISGYADFALVQATGSQTAPSEYEGMALSVAQDALSDLPRLTSSLQTYLARHGVAPGRDGFVKVSENATIYHFRDVVSSESTEVVDSTLLVLMDIAERGAYGENDYLEKWYAPGDQAVVVSGDVDASAVAEKLKMLSYMIPSRVSQERKGYEWQECEDPVFETSPYVIRNLATVSATWAFPRTPKEYMNTIQPAIYEMFVAEIGMIAKERLSYGLKSKGIPAAGVSFHHITSVRSLGDEQFSISLSVAPEHTAEAVAILASTMSSIDSGTTTVHELEMARKRYIFNLDKQARDPFKTNSDYVDRCASAFLYNSPLSSEKEIADFLRSRNLDIDSELSHFNNIASAILDSRRNLTVECRTGGGNSFDSASLAAIFSDSWAAASDHVVCPAPLDSIPLPGGIPVKLKSARTEPLSGGVMWTFANGFKVVYRRQESGRRMHYTLAMNGGYGNIPDLSEGEGAYMTDFMKLSKVSGMSYDEFSRILENEDISLDATVNLSNMLICGSAPDSRIDLMMRSLLGLVNQREYDRDAYEYYLSCQDVEHEVERGTLQERIAAMDSLICPDNRYSFVKSQGKLTPEFPSKADAFLKYQSSKMNDGVLVLVGNVEETRLRKLIQNHVGGFVTTERTFPRTVVNYQPVSGATVYTKRGHSNSADFILSSRMSLTAENHMASHIAADILRQAVSAALDGTGMHLKLSHKCRIYPQERFNVMISLEEASEYGFSGDARLSGLDAALKEVRKVLAGLQSMEVSDKDVAKYKSLLKGRLAMEMKQPQYWTRAVAMRYMDGKDFTSGYEARIDAVTSGKVRSILASLADASRVEYIIRK